jgi:hypothetical protein
VTKKKTDPTPKRKRGRPPYKSLDKNKLKKDLESGLSQHEALKLQGIGYDRVNDLAKKDADLVQLIKEGPEEYRNRFSEAIKPMIVSAYRQKVMDGDVAAILYGMKAIVGFKEGIKHEVSGEIQHIHTLSPEDRAKRIAQLRQELEAQVVDVAIESENKDDTSGA